MAKKITLPLTEELAKTLHAGDQVLLTGTIYTSRDAGHKRMCEALAKGEKIPFDPTDAPNYQRPYGCLCTNHDVRRCPWNDW